MLLDLVVQLGPCRIEPVGRWLLRVRGGSDQPEVVAVLRRAGGERERDRRLLVVGGATAPRPGGRTAAGGGSVCSRPAKPTEPHDVTILVGGSGRMGPADYCARAIHMANKQSANLAAVRYERSVGIRWA